MKTKKAAAKRYSLTAKGKIKIKKANLRHILEKKNSDHNRSARKIGYVDKADVRQALRCLPYR